VPDGLLVCSLFDFMARRGHFHEAEVRWRIGPSLIKSVFGVQ
jgi:hypothetical protein